MYPTLTDLIYDLTGFTIPMGIQSFGMMMALAFLFAAWLLTVELKRKEKNGLLASGIRKKLNLEKVSNTDILLYTFFGFIIGYKILFILLNYSSCTENPQEVLFSTSGNWMGGILLATIFGFLKYREKEKQKNLEQKEIEEVVHPYQHVGNITMVAAVSGIIGAKVFDFLESPSDFANILEDPASVLFSGLTMYGGLIFGTIAVSYYAYKNELKIPVLADALAPSLMLAYGVGRIGCQIAGDGDWGIDNLSPKPSWMSFLPDWLWSFRYAHNVNNVGIQIPGCEGKHCFILENPVFPTPLYEAMACILLFFVLWSLRKKIKIPGILFFLYLAMNGVERFFIEKIRINSTYSILGHHITQAEIISTCLFFTGVAGIIYFGKRKTAVT